MFRCLVVCVFRVEFSCWPKNLGGRHLDSGPTACQMCSSPDGAARRKARDSFSIVVNFDQSGSRSSGKMPDDTKSAAGAIAVALRLSARCVIVLLLEGDCHIELQLEGDHNVGRFDKAAG
jgi:hypothetical protein